MDKSVVVLDMHERNKIKFEDAANKNGYHFDQLNSIYGWKSNNPTEVSDDMIKKLVEYDIVILNISIEEANKLVEEMRLYSKKNTIICRLGHKGPYYNSPGNWLEYQLLSISSNETFKSHYDYKMESNSNVLIDAFESACACQRYNYYTTPDFEPIEDEKERERKSIDDKVYGIYSGSCKKIETSKSLSEVELYLYIKTIEKQIRKCRSDEPKKDLTEDQYALEYLVYQTTNFKIKLHEPEVGKHVVPTSSYWKWFENYDNHFSNLITQEQVDNFIKTRKLI